MGPGGAVRPRGLIHSQGSFSLFVAHSPVSGMGHNLLAVGTPAVPGVFQGRKVPCVATNTLPAKRTGKAGSTIFLKTLMAGSGIFFVLFVLGHMYGNLKLLAGESAFNEYAHHLRTIGEPMLPHRGALILAEVLLVLALVAHVYSAVKLWQRSGKARSQRYAVKTSGVGGIEGISAPTMRWGGLFLLLFVVFHLIQFTLPKVNFDGGTTENPYRLVHDSFQLWWVALIYVLAMVALGMHLMHGIWSASQTLGLTGTPSARKNAKLVSHAVAAIVVIGFLIPPLAILFGII